MAWGPAFPETLTFVPPRIWGGDREGNTYDRSLGKRLRQYGRSGRFNT
jgi:hypothetical protein